MIRRFENKDLDQVMSIWLQVNMESHFFIEADYWKNNYEMVREMIPKAEVFVSEENGQIRGFIGLIDTYIAGIFVRVAEQSKGVGTELLHTVMKLRDNLRLNVYKKNTKVVSFYRHYGFQIINQGIDESTLEEYTMEWHRQAIKNVSYEQEKRYNKDQDGEEGGTMAVGQITWERFITSNHDARGVRYKFEDLSRQLFTYD